MEWDEDTMELGEDTLEPGEEVLESGEEVMESGEEVMESDEEGLSLGRQILPVARKLPADFDGVPQDGMQYLFTVRRDARQLPHVTRVSNPYEIPERPPLPTSDPLLPVHPSLPTSEWCTLFETRFRNFRKNCAQPTTHVHRPARNNNRKVLPELKERDLWWKFLSGRPAEEWDPPKKPKQNRNFQRGMRAFADDPSTTGSPSGLPSETRHMDVEPLVSDAPQPVEQRREQNEVICTPLEPTPSLLRLIDHRMALHLLMYFTHWTNLHLQADKRHRITQTHARWIFGLLSRVDDYVSADEMHLLRNLTRAYVSLLKSLTHPKTVADTTDLNPICCWLIISTVVGVWGQRDLWSDAADTISRT